MNLTPCAFPDSDHLGLKRQFPENCALTFSSPICMGSLPTNEARGHEYMRVSRQRTRQPPSTIKPLRFLSSGRVAPAIPRFRPKRLASVHDLRELTYEAFYRHETWWRVCLVIRENDGIHVTTTTCPNWHWLTAVLPNFQDTRAHKRKLPHTLAHIPSVPLPCPTTGRLVVSAAAATATSPLILDPLRALMVDATVVSNATLALELGFHLHASLSGRSALLTVSTGTMTALRRPSEYLTRLGSLLAASPRVANLDGNQANSKNCCSSQYNTPATCPPSGVQFYSYLKDRCPRSYVYAHDESSGTALWTCPASMKAEYSLTFCLWAYWEWYLVYI